MPNPKCNRKIKKSISKYERLFEHSVKKIELKDLIIFHWQPHNPNYPCTPIHLYISQNGSASLTVRELVNHLCFYSKLIRKSISSISLQMEMLAIQNFISAAIINNAVLKPNPWYRRHCGKNKQPRVWSFSFCRSITLCKTLRTKI